MNHIIQVAGVIDVQEAKMLIECGVDYLGFPLRLPVNKEDLSEEEAIEVIKEIHNPHKAVLITYLSECEEIIRFCDNLNVNTIQLHGRITLNEIKKLKLKRPDIEIIKSLVVHENNYPELVYTLKELTQWVDLFITDTFDPVTGASGATGKTHDWEISKKLVMLSPKPILLAGGLNPNNVKQALLETKAAGVDVHTGVEGQGGRKDFNLVKNFVFQARQAFDEQ